MGNRGLLEVQKKKKKLTQICKEKKITLLVLLPEKEEDGKGKEKEREWRKKEEMKREPEETEGEERDKSTWFLAHVFWHRVSGGLENKREQNRYKIYRTNKSTTTVHVISTWRRTKDQQQIPPPIPTLYISSL